MSRYREIYSQLEASINAGPLGSGKPTITDDLLRDAGVEAYSTDNRVAGIEAALVYLAERVKELEEK